MPGLLGRSRNDFATAYCNRHEVPMPGGRAAALKFSTVASKVGASTFCSNLPPFQADCARIAFAAHVQASTPLASAGRAWT